MKIHTSEYYLNLGGFISLESFYSYFATTSNFENPNCSEASPKLTPPSSDVVSEIFILAHPCNHTSTYTYNQNTVNLRFRVEIYQSLWCKLVGIEDFNQLLEDGFLMANQSTIISMTSNRYLGHYIESWWVNYDRYWEELLMGIIDSKETLGTIVYLESSLGEEVIGKVLGEFLERSVKWCDNKSEVIEMSF